MFGAFVILNWYVINWSRTSIERRYYYFAVVGWGRDQINQPQSFGQEEKGIKQQIANLIHAVRTVMRGRPCVQYHKMRITNC